MMQLPLQVLVLASVLLQVSTATSLFDELSSQFETPPTKYRSNVFWHWVNGNVDKSAIASDIEAMYNSGFGGVLLSSVQAGLPAGPVAFNSDEWLDRILYSAQLLKEKGMLMSMHNAPGYSGVGSPQLPINMTMKELMWTETRVASNSSNSTTFLDHPFQKLGVYKDLYVLAYPALPAEGTVFRDAVADVKLNGVPIDANITRTIVLDSPPRLESSSDYLQFDMKDLFTAQAVAIYRIPEIPSNTFDGARDYPPSWKLSVSNDSVTWSAVTIDHGVFPALRKMDAPATMTFAETTAKYFRLNPSGPSWVTSIDVSSGPRLPDWATKSHAAPGGIPSASSTFESIASAIDPGSVIDVASYMDTSGNLSWKPRNGTYTVVRIGYTVTGQEMAATPDDAYSLNADLFSTEAIDAHFSTHLDRILDALKPYIPDTFFGLEIDSYENGMQNWGGNLAEDFQSLKGYSLIPWILAATGRVLESSLATEKFLYDFRTTHSHLTATNTYGYFQKKLRQYGLSLMVEPYGDGPFDGLEISTNVDYAYGEMWAHYTYGSDGYTQLGTSSTASHQHSRVTFQESFTGHPFTSAFTEHPYGLKAQGDRETSLGTNRFYMHSYAHQPVDAAFPGMNFGPFGTHLDRMSTWTKQAPGWLSHTARTALLLQNSNRLPDVACFVGEEPNNGAIITYNSPFNVPLEYQSDPIGLSNLMSMTAMGSKAIYTEAAPAYSLLIFPAMPAASVAILKKLTELANAGVPLLLQETVPSRALGRNDTDSAVVALAEQLWGMAGNGVVFVGNTNTQVLSALGLQPSFTFTSSSNDAALYFSHTVIDDEEVYFVSNGLRNRLNVTVSLRANSGTPQIWNPQTAMITTPLAWARMSNRTVIGLTFGPSESIFIRLSQAETTARSISSVVKDGNPIYSVDPFPAFAPKPHANISSTFTIALWVKPEVYLLSTEGYAFYPPVNSAYGLGHSAIGLTIGTQKLEILEASTSTPQVIMTFDQEFSGWTHLALVYNDDTPSLFINGILNATGTRSSFTVHPGVGTPDSTDQMTSRLNGDKAGVLIYDSALGADAVMDLYNAGLPPPEEPPAVELISGSKLLFRQNGEYNIAVDSKPQVFNISSNSFEFITSPWTVQFPLDRMPHKSNPTLSITLTELQSLHLHPDFDVAHFSGTCTYTTTFQLPKGTFSSANTAILLNLGRVENIAEVSVNGKYLGISWIPPYEVDISSAVNSHGVNTLSIDVTNLWPNRLIGDESLPTEDVFNTTNVNWAVENWPEWWVDHYHVKTGERVTFSAWHHYNATGLPLLASGLLGPVKITTAYTQILL